MVMVHVTPVVQLYILLGVPLICIVTLEVSSLVMVLININHSLSDGDRLGCSEMVFLHNI